MTEVIYGVREVGYNFDGSLSKGRIIMTAQRNGGTRKIQERARWSRWYPRKTDSIIIGYWAEACSDKHNNCLNCIFLEECQDLVDRLTECIDVRRKTDWKSIADYR